MHNSASQSRKAQNQRKSSTGGGRGSYNVVPEPVAAVDFTFERAAAYQCVKWKEYGIDGPEKVFFTERAAEVLAAVRSVTLPYDPTPVPLLPAILNAVDAAKEAGTLGDVLRLQTIQYGQLEPCKTAPYAKRDPPKDTASYASEVFEQYSVPDDKAVYVLAPESEVCGGGFSLSQSPSTLSCSMHPSHTPHRRASAAACSVASSTGCAAAITSHPTTELFTSHLLSSQSSFAYHASSPHLFTPNSHALCLRCSLSRSFASSAIRFLQN